jgi:tetraacyldisaccharide 4'-kinase
MQIFVNKCWYSHHPLRWILFPFTLLYQFITTLRRIYLQRFCQQRFSVPVVVVGNLTVGGVGKTPLVIALACEFQARGLRVGIVSRGYGASISHYPHEVSNTDTAQMVGDEPLLLVKKANCPVVIAPKRIEAVQYLLDHHDSQIIISDDGLQHYAMGRAIEIVVIDGLRGLGNGMCLPSGPLREGKRRLKTVDFLVVNGGERPDAYRMDLQPGEITQLITGKILVRNDLKGPVAAVAAIGHPRRFFETLKKMDLEFNAYPFNDHHCFTPDELLLPEKVVVMTEKDAVKCESFATDDMYVLPVDAVVSDKFWDALWSHKQLQGLK